MSSQGPLNPATAVDDASTFGQNAWVNVNNSLASDNSYTTVQVGPAITPSDYLKVTNFGFSIPTGSTITGIVVEIEKKCSTANGVKDERVRIVKGGSYSATDRSDSNGWSTTEGYVTYGSSSDLWGETWTASDINSSTFGIAIAVRHNAAAAPIASIDHIRITVYYSGASELVNFEGYELGDDAYANLAGTASIQSSVVKTGNYALLVNPTTTSLGFATWYATNSYGTLEDENFNLDTIYLTFYFRYGTKPVSNSEELLAIGSTIGGEKFFLRLNSAGNLMAFDKTGTVQIGSTGSTVLSVDTWYKIECSVATGASAAFEVRLNGTTEISGTGDLSTGNTSVIYFGKIENQNGQTIAFYYDDIALSINNYIGNGAVVLLRPNENGFYNDWAGDYSDVDEIPPDENTTYIYDDSGIDSNYFSVGLQSVNQVPINGSINAVKSVAIARKTGGATGSISSFIRSYGTDLDNTDTNATSSSYSLHSRISLTDPYTTLPYTKGDINQLQVGVINNDSATSPNELRTTFMGLMVHYNTDNVQESINCKRLRVVNKTAATNLVTVILQKITLRNRVKSTSIITNSILSISKKRLKASAKQAGKSETLSIGKIRLKTRNKTAAFTAAATANLNVKRLKTRNKTATSNGTPIYPANGGIPLYIGGSLNSQLSISLPLYINSVSATNPGVFKSLDLSITGRTATASGGGPDNVFPLYIKGSDGPASGSIPLYISGPITSGTVSASLPLYLEARIPSGFLRLYIKGKGLTDNSPDGAMQASGFIPLYLHHPGAYNSINLFLKVADVTSGNMPVYINGILGTASSGLPLYTYGYESGTATINLFTKGF